VSYPPRYNSIKDVKCEKCEAYIGHSPVKQTNFPFGLGHHKIECTDCGRTNYFDLNGQHISASEGPR